VAVVVGADVLTHTASSGNNELSISLRQAVKEETTRFGGTYSGITVDIELMTLASGSCYHTGHGVQEKQCRKCGSSKHPSFISLPMSIFQAFLFSRG
jgi:hypothetical protein